MFRLKHSLAAGLFLFSLAAWSWPFGRQAAAERAIIFPVIGKTTFSNDYNAPRNYGPHHATDIIAAKGLKEVAAVSGTITDVEYPEPDWGYSITIRDDDGYSYRYIHMNDDTPGTNDGKGGGMHAYAPDMRVGNRVAAGQHVGWVGDSGHANGVAHLHFEMFLPGGKVANPYQSLVHAKHISRPVIPGRVTDEILPYGRTSRVRTNVALGNFDVDPAQELVVGPGPGGGPQIKVYQDNNSLSKGFDAYDPDFKGGVDVATGDVDLDGIDEIITVPRTGGAHVRVFEADGTPVTGFFAFDSSIHSGASVAAGDVNGDGRDEIIIGLGPGSEPKVRIFNLASGQPVQAHSFFAYDPAFRGGVDVAAGNVSLTNANDEVVVAPGAGGAPAIRVLDANGVQLANFRAYGTAMKFGVRVSVGNVRTGTLASEILTLPAAKAAPQIKMFDGSGSLINSNYFIERWWIGGYDVAAGFGDSKAGLGGNRRASIRPGIN